MNLGTLIHIFAILLLLVLSNCEPSSRKSDEDQNLSNNDSVPSLKVYRNIEESKSLKVDSVTEEVWAQNWEAGRIVSPENVKAYGKDRCFQILEINDSIFKRIDGVSFKNNGIVKIQDLRYLRLIHYDLNGNIRLGELICNAKIAEDLRDIFKVFFDSVYPVANIRLIDEYGADDETSMQANNTSCFNFRPTPGGGKISRHAYGMAVDLNPLYNPYVNPKKGKVLPPEGEIYLSRNLDFPYKIDKEDLAYREFSKRGFKWGGNWRTMKDYQHFEK